MEVNYKRKISGLIFFTVTILVLSAGFALYPVFAAPPTTKYSPGETTDPTCSPGDPNCSVFAPITSSSIDGYAVTTLSGGSGLVVSSPTGTVVLSLDIDNTLTTSTQLGLNLNNENSWLATQNFSSTTISSSTIGYLVVSNNLSFPNDSITDAMVGDDITTSNYLSLVNWNSTTTDALSEGIINKYFSDSLARSAVSSTAMGLVYTSSTGIFSLDSNYIIPLTVSSTNWETAYGWNNHALVGYITDGNTGWDNSYNYITNAGETDQVWISASSSYLRLDNVVTSTWNTAYTDRLKWDGGSTGLVAATGRTSLELGSMALATTTDYANLSLDNVFSGTTNTFSGAINIGVATASSSFSSSLHLISGKVNSAEAVAAAIDTGVAWSTVGASLLTLSNKGVLKTSFDYNGLPTFGRNTQNAGYVTISSSGNSVIQTIRSTSGGNGLTLSSTKTVDAVSSQELASVGTTSPLALTSGVNNTMGSGASALVLRTVTALTDTSYKLIDIRNGGVSKAYFDINGDLLVGSGTALLPGLSFTADTDTGIYWAAANNLALTTSGTQRMIIDENGNVGIGTSTPAFKFQVYVSAGNEGHVDATGAWANTSDERLKKNIITLDSALEKVMNLRGVRYDWRINENATSSSNIGFIAQEVEQIFPQFVSAGNNGIKGVAYGSLTPVLVEAIKEQQGEIENLSLMLPINFTSNTINGLKIDYDILTTEIIPEKELGNFDWLVKNTLKKFGMLITDGLAKFRELIAGKITAKNELCVGSTCFNEDQLKTMLQTNGNTAVVETTVDSTSQTIITPLESPQPETHQPIIETPISESTISEVTLPQDITVPVVLPVETSPVTPLDTITNATPIQEISVDVVL